MIDKNYCCNSFLIYRFIADSTKSFSPNCPPFFFKEDTQKYDIKNADDVQYSIERYVEEIVSQGGKIGLALSGGIDSAILARFVPKDTVTYTFRCVSPGTLDETEVAANYAEMCGLNHKIVDVTWDDYLKSSLILMKHKGAPIHSIEPQIYTAALRAKEDGVTHFLFGENADIIFGGMNGLLSKDWTFDEFVRRYSYLDPTKILHEGAWILQPFEQFRIKSNPIDMIDFYGFICRYFYHEANNSYDNACTTAGVKYVSPFNRMRLTTPLDYERIRGGESKYILRELFCRLYPTLTQPAKIPMPRAVSQWLQDWEGPTRPEFLPHCTDGLSGDQKWMVFILERFLNMIENDKC